MTSVISMANIIHTVEQARTGFGMGHSQADKAGNRERILNEAAAQIRAGGLESVGVGRLMRSVDLTHGGFYGHFASRTDLLRQALERALVTGRAASRAANDPSHRGMAAFVRSYMSRAHRDAPQTGCAIAALAGDVARADAATRDVMQSHVDEFIDNVARTMGDTHEARATLVVSALVGGLLLSRVMTDPKRSDAVLRAVRDGVVALAEQSPEESTG